MDALLGLVCLGLVFNLFISVPIGGVIGHFAKGRWRDGAGLGFLLGPLGWILIAVLEDPRRRCPACRSTIPEDAMACRHCGERFPSPAPVVMPAPAPPAVEPEQATEPVDNSPPRDPLFTRFLASCSAGYAAMRQRLKRKPRKPPANKPKTRRPKKLTLPPDLK